ADLGRQHGASQVESGGVVIVGDQHPVADPKAAGFGKRDRPLIRVAVGRKCGCAALDWREHGLIRGADKPHMVAQGNGVAERISSWPDAYRAAAKIGDVIYGCLNCAVVAAAHVAVVDANMDRWAFFRFVRSGGWSCVNEKSGCNKRDGYCLEMQHCRHLVRG